MRITPPTLALASLLAIISSVAHSQHNAASQNPRSQAFVVAGDAALALPDKASDAADAYEAALALDPANRAALIGMARAAMAQGLPGKAIHFYREALALEPNDIAVLEGQGEALVAKGGIVKASENLTKIKMLCVSACPEQTALNNAITKATSSPSVSAADVISKPVVSQGVAKAN